MALHWQLPSPHVISDPHAENLIWLTMIVQIGHLTEKSLPEFRRRLSLYQKHVNDFTPAQWNKWFIELLSRNLARP